MPVDESGGITSKKLDLKVTLHPEDGMYRFLGNYQNKE